MPTINPTIDAYFKSPYISPEKKANMARDLDSGKLTEPGALQVISRKYPDLVQATPTTPPASDKIVGDVIKKGINILNPANLSENLGSAAVGASKAIQILGKKPATEGQEEALAQIETERRARDEQKAKAVQELNKMGFVPPSTVNGEVTTSEQLSEAATALRRQTSPLGPVNEAIMDVQKKSFGQMAEGAKEIGEQVVSGQFNEEGSQKAAEGLQKTVGGMLGVLTSPIGGAIDLAPEELKKPVGEASQAGMDAIAKSLVKFINPSVTEDQLNDPKVLDPARLAIQIALTFSTLSDGAQKSPAKQLENKKAGKLGEETFRKVNPPKTREAELLQKEDIGKIKGYRSTAESIYENNVKGLTKKSLGDNAAIAADKIWKKSVHPALETSDKTLNVQNYLDDIQKEIDALDDPVRQSTLRKGYDALLDEYTRPGTNLKDLSNIRLVQGQSLKAGLDEFTPTKMFKGEDVANGYMQVKHMLADKIRSGIHQALPEEIGVKYYDYGNLKEFSETGVIARTQAASMGGAGRLGGDILRALGRPALTIAGRAIYKIGNVWYQLATSSLGEMILSPATAAQIAVVSTLKE